jgi:hypothetical protein
MKTKQTKIDRSGAKWLPGAMAIAATTAGAQAATVQITLSGNKISTTGGNQLVADLTGDGAADAGRLQIVVVPGGVGARIGYFGNSSGSGFVSAKYRGPDFVADAAIFGGGVGVERLSGGSPQSTTYLNSISFSDSRINSGVKTEGWLEVTAFNTSTTDHTVQLTRLIFDDASTIRPGFTSIPGTQTAWAAVPEPSSMALLALGAGGLALRRSRSRKAKAA